MCEKNLFNKNVAMNFTNQVNSASISAVNIMTEQVFH